MIELRDYQKNLVDSIADAAYSGHRRIIVQLPTGAGKTLVAGEMVRHAISNNQRVLFLAHRRELIWQTVEKLKMFGVYCTVLVPGEPYDPRELACVASIQTLHARAIRRRVIVLPPADLVICDEFAHAFSSGTWQKILDSYKNSWIVGLTATPINRRGHGMGHCADFMVKGPSIQHLIDLGHLVPVTYFCPSLPDLTKLKIQAGDYVQNQLEERMDKPKLIGDILTNWSKICPDRKTIVFASGIKHSIHIAEAFNSIGVVAAHLDGNTLDYERDKIIQSFHNGKIQVLSNCAVLTEGFDDPIASALVFARPTKSLMLYLQIAGRVLRPAPGKNDCIILDHAGVIYQHGLIAQDWDWKLEYGEGKTISETMKRKKKKEHSITCENCKCVYEGRLDCPNCGTRPTIHGKMVETIEAYLEELNAESLLRPEDKRKWWAMLRSYGNIHGYKTGWAWHKFKEKFSVYPSNNWYSDAGQLPDLEIQSWIKSRQIAWGRRNRKNEIMEEKHAHIGKIEQETELVGL